MPLIFLRHGESEGNARGLIQGWLDYPLTERGREQAFLAASHLVGAGAATLYSSPLRRARETAEAVSAETAMPIVEEVALSEYHFGEAEGLRWEQAAERWGLSDHDWGVGGVPGEEGIAAFRTRVGAAFDELLDRHRDDLAICVAHGGVIGAAVAHVCGLAPRSYAQIYTANCSVTRFERDERGPVITALNEQCHLRVLDEPLA